MKKLNIGITEDSRLIISEFLNLILANEYVLYTKTLNFHWNVKGSDFACLHEFFEKQYQELFALIDEIAERVQALGNTPSSTLEEFKQNATIKEALGESHSDAKGMIEILLEGHEILINQIRKTIPLIDKEYNDAASANLLIDVLEHHEKASWMLRSLLDDNDH